VNQISEWRLLIPAVFISSKKTPPVRSHNLAAVSAGSPPVVRRLFEVN
jgi:hypothetical protein